MSQALSRIDRLPKLSRLGWLMGLYAENYLHLFTCVDLFFNMQSA